MKKIMKYVLIVLSMLPAVSCIENDLSYPYVLADILSIELEGQKSVTIDNDARTVEIVMGETADMSNVKVVSYRLSDEAEVVGGMPEYLDLRYDNVLTLRVYEDFEWTVKAVQPIERYVRCENQIGEAEIDLASKMVYVYVHEDQPLESIRINEMKLEPEGSEITRTLGFILQEGSSRPVTEECVFPGVYDCVILRYFYVEYKGKEIEWAVNVLHKAVEVEVESVEPWACFAMVKGMTDGKGELVLEYRKSSDTEWIACDDVKVKDSNVNAIIKGLEPETDYVVRLSNGETVTEGTAFRTEKVEQLPNMGFDDWYMAGKAWMPNANAGSQIWDTANPGSAPVGTVPTVPEETIVVKGKAVKMETMLTNILGIRKLAAGNIYTGKFDQLAGLGAELDWGVPFGARPLALRGYYKYSPATIDVVEDSGYAEYEGQPDQCQIQVFLSRWDKPFHVNSSAGTFVDKNDKSIIAFSEIYSSEANDEYVRFTMPIEYNDDRMPNYIVISGCASRFGNYFVGGVGSVLYIDEFELVYDPAELSDEEFAAVFSKMK